jgi:hypothetical protein
LGGRDIVSPSRWDEYENVKMGTLKLGRKIGTLLKIFTLQNGGNLVKNGYAEASVPIPMNLAT